MKNLLASFLLLLTHDISHAQGLVEPIVFYQEEAEEDSSWEVTLPPLLPTNDSEIGQA
jgi:hypothetical protein